MSWRGGVNVSPSGNSALLQSTRDRRRISGSYSFLPAITPPASPRQQFLI
jgi:hypothetical protein